jgi:amino acid permease
MLHELSSIGGQIESHRIHGWPPSSSSVRRFCTISRSILTPRTSLTVVSVNCLGIRVFGELEFWFSSIKVITLIGLIIFGIIVG